MNFSNFLLLISRDELLPLNCSLYYLSTGSIGYDDLDNGQKVVNDALLPAYYITNCSISDLVSYVETLTFNLADYSLLSKLTSNKRDDGDSYVALLFITSGSCVSAWMLSFLLYLSPEHKRKPLSVHIATIVFTALSTLILHQLTQYSSMQYYSNALDLIELRSLIEKSLSYLILSVISQALSNLAWLQIIIHTSKLRLRPLSTICYSTLIVLYTAINIAFSFKFKSSSILVQSKQFRVWRTAMYASKLTISLYFGVNLIYYTFIIKNPKKISYSKKLMPLGIFSLILVLLDIVILILELSIFRMKWLTNTWLALVPQVLEVIMLTTVWEWIYNMEILEKKLELMGVLGRRLSLDDALHPQNQETYKQNNWRKIISFGLLSSNDRTNPVADNENLGEGSLTDRDQDRRSHSEEPGPRRTSIGSDSNSSSIVNYPVHSDDSTYEIEYVDDYDSQDEGNEALREEPGIARYIHNHNPPPFISDGEYNHGNWNDAKR